mmetsp:Transcript_69632/g.185417  ORF Transcript_69632/g.185417 Transcript_69632/m.185417 type:complete len:270 (+) Transcript_69632:1956-2765(+)
MVIWMLACIRRAVASDPSLLIVEQVMIAVWWHTQGYLDKAIATASAIIVSCGSCTPVGRMAALHIRAESRKFHHSGTLIDQAASDFMELVALRPPEVIASRCGRGLAGSNISVVDEWLSLLHPSFSELCPRPAVFYPCARKRALDIVSLAVSFVGVMRRRVAVRKRLGTVHQTALLLRDRAVALDSRWNCLELMTRPTSLPERDHASVRQPSPRSTWLASSVCRSCSSRPWPATQRTCDQCEVCVEREVEVAFGNHVHASHSTGAVWLA